MQINSSLILGMRATRTISRRMLTANRVQSASFSSQMAADDDYEKSADRPSPESFRTANQIKLSSSTGNHNDYLPMTDFDMTPFSPALKKILMSEGFSGPTPTQAQSWPIAIQSRDIISVARTGSGKTCGFLLPAFHKLIADKASGKVQQTAHSNSPYARESVREPTVLVLAPTRELTVQIETEARKFARPCGFQSVW